MSIRNIVHPTRVNKTLAEWALDSVVYSENKILVSEDLFYPGTNQPRYKLANGVNTWADLDYVPAGSTDTNMANDDLTLDDHRAHDAAGFSWSLRDLRQLNFESTSTPSGQPAVKFEFNNGSSNYSDTAFQFILNNNTTFPAIEMKGNGNVGIGLPASSSNKLYVYSNTSGINAIRGYTDNPNTTTLSFQADGANSIGIEGQANGTNGVGARLQGKFLGALIEASDSSGNGARILGGSLVAEAADTDPQNDSALLHLRTENMAALLVNPITKTQRDIIPPVDGMIIYMEYFDEDNLEGLYLYTDAAAAWRRFSLDA